MRNGFGFGFVVGDDVFLFSGEGEFSSMNMVETSLILFTEGLDYSTLFESDKVDFHEIIALVHTKFAVA